MATPQWTGLDAWKALAAKGEAPAETALRKAYVAEIKAGEGDARTIDFTISTGTVDREHDVISPEGWKLAAFKKNPTVLWAHDYATPPIARATKIKLADGTLKATAEFAPAEVYPFAETIYQLLKGGFLQATSVGFRPLKYAFNAERGGVDFESQELLEFSIVPVPANAECLMEGKAAGIDVEPLKAWAEGVLKRLNGDDAQPAKMSTGEAANAGRLHQMIVTAHQHATDAADMAHQMLHGKQMSDAESQMMARVQGSLNDARTHLQSAMDGCGMVAGKAARPIARVVPGNPSGSPKAGKDEPWSAPSLQDFTDQAWTDLSDGEKRSIAKHFAWANQMPPDSYGDLKLPHHRPSDGAVVFRGVVAAAGRMNQTAGIDEAAVKAHLAAHYRQFDETPPWEQASAEPAVTKLTADEIRTLIRDELDRRAVAADVLFDLESLDWAPEPECFELDVPALRAAVGAAIDDGLRDLVGAAVRREVNALTGRVD